MGRSLKKRITLKIGDWNLTEHNGSWKVKGRMIQFTLREETEGRWKVSYQSTADSEAVQKRNWFKAKDLSQALEKAVTFFFGHETQSAGLKVSEVLARWVATIPAKESTLSDYDIYNRVFLNWIQKEGIQYWSKIRLEHLQAYAKFLKSEGSAWDTVRLYTYPIRSASRWASLNWPGEYSHFAEGFRLTRRPSKKAAQPLRIAEVAEFLAFLEKEGKGRQLLAGVAMQCLCGLRVTEVLRLTWDRVNLETGTIAVDGEVKNDASRRVLPVPGLVLETLERMPSGGERILSEFPERSYWYRAVRSALKRWKADRVVPPKVFRKTLATEMRIRRWNRDAVDLYYGHAERDVLGAHYIHETESDRLRIFREEVANKVDEALLACAPVGASSDDKVVPLRKAQ